MPTTLNQLPYPVMRASASFHTNQTRFQIGEKLRHLGTAQLFAQHGFTVCIYSMNLKYFLCKINTYRSNLHGGRSSLF